MEQRHTKNQSTIQNTQEKELFTMLRYMDEETAFAQDIQVDSKELKINGHDALLINNNCLDIKIDNVLYSFYGNDEITQEDLIKMAESLS